MSYVEYNVRLTKGQMDKLFKKHQKEDSITL